jgi:VanZ family protein
MEDGAQSTRSGTRLPHVLAALYGLAIVYASLEPFQPWLLPPPNTPFFLFGATPAHWIRYDALLNVLAYVPFGFFVALVRRGVSPARRIGYSVAIGATMSFAMESLQMYIPPRVASPLDLIANIVGVTLGSSLATVLAGNAPTRISVYRARTRLFLPGHLGDIGLALLLLWLAAQTNPGIPLFAVTFGGDPVASSGVMAPSPLPQDDASTIAHESAGVVVQAAGTGFQVLGVGLFAALLLRRRRNVGTIVIALILCALLLKGFAAALLLKPAIWQSWLKPGVLIGVAAGVVLLRVAIALPRPAQVALCAIALLSSLGAPLLAPEIMSTHVPLGIFDWHYGQLLNYNGLTRAALLVWPLLTAMWLFVLAGRPAWGKPPPDPA